MKISRIAQLGAVAAIAALTLAGCASNEGGTTSPSDSAARPHRHAQRRRRILAAGRRPGVDRRVPDRQPRRHDQLRPLGFRRRSRDLPSRRRRVRRLRPRVQGRGDRAGAFDACVDGTDLVDLPVYISPIAIFNVEGVDDAQPRRRRPSPGIFAGTITNWNDPAIAAMNDDATLPDLAHHARAPLRRLGHDQELHRLPRPGRPDVWTYEPVEEWPFQGGEAAQGTSGVVDAVTKRQRHHRLRRRIAPPRPRRRQHQGRRRVRRRPPRRAAAVVDASPLVEGRARPTSPSSSTAPRPRPASTRSCS